MVSAAYAVVNLAAFKHNLKKVREFAPKAKIMAVIKANAYGHGLLRIAKILDGVDACAVARVDEGILLRQAGFNNRITILEGFVCEVELHNLIQYDLDVVVHSVGQVDILERYQGGKKITVWLKLDTGMNRLGFKQTDFNLSYQRLLKCKGVHQPVSLMTHLSHADDLESEITKKQVLRFKDVVKDFPGEKSIANSAGIIAWSDSVADWVRPGIMLYGVSPFSDQMASKWGLQPVMSLHSRLIAVKTLESGETVGYSGSWVCKKSTKIGVVAIGYGDGYPRYTKTGTPLLVNGCKVPLIGKVSMDMITVDLGNQPNAKEGDPVTLWGDGLAIEEIAKYSDTIPYTLLCGITQRVEIEQL